MTAPTSSCATCSIKAGRRAILDFLFDYSYLNPQVPELDSIVPLPPAKLPPWDGKFEWLEAHEANVPPPLPTEERIAEMAASAAWASVVVAQGAVHSADRRAGRSAGDGMTC
jgi:hypothetical protein